MAQTHAEEHTCAHSDKKYPQIQKECFTLYFETGTCHIDNSYADNAYTVESMKELLRDIDSDDAKSICNVEFCASASPEGPIGLNHRLSAERLQIIENTVCSCVEIPDDMVSRKDLGIPWNYVDSIISIDIYRPERFFPLLRQASCTIIYRNSNICCDGCKNEGSHPDSGLAAISSESFDSSKELDTSEHASTESTAAAICPFYMSIRTNLLYDAAMIPAVGVEFALTRRLSIAAQWHYSWWGAEKSTFCWKNYGGDLALRYWFGGSCNDRDASLAKAFSPLSGHHLGIYGQMLTYDFEVGGRGYQAPQWNWAAGLEYGYALPVAKRLNIDFNIGVGYMGGRFMEYVPIDDHFVWQATRNTCWIGPTKAEISLVWLLGRNNINRK